MLVELFGVSESRAVDGGGGVLGHVGGGGVPVLWLLDDVDFIAAESGEEEKGRDQLVCLLKSVLLSE